MRCLVWSTMAMGVWSTVDIVATVDQWCPQWTSDWVQCGTYVWIRFFAVGWVATGGRRGWSKVVNKQGQPVTRKSGDVTLRHCADADDIIYMMATHDINKVPLPRFVAEDLDRIPAVVGLQCRSLDYCAQTVVTQLSMTVEELTKRLENMETESYIK